MTGRKKAQSIEEIRSISEGLLARDRDASSERNETTPIAITPELIAFCAEVAEGVPVMVPVVDDPLGLYGFCSDGVEQKVAADGGSPVFGWTMWEWPGLFWTAEFHAVWKSPDGNLLDITPKPGAENSIVFLPDSSYPTDFDFDDRPGNRRKRAYPDQDKASLAEEMIENMKPSQVAYETARAEKAAISLSDWIERKVKTDPLPGVIDAFLAACDEQEDYFDSMGVSGMVTANHKLIELVNKRMGLQAELGGLLKTRKFGKLR